jgi:glycosyltransferase involved in cell wall biosynthesis
MPDKSAVSILMPIHNCEKTLARSLDSIYNQTHGNFEIVAVLNRCTDNSQSILLKYFNDNWQHITILKCDEPGIVPTLNTGIPHCRYDLIARQDGDDYWYPDKLKKQIDFLNNNPDIDIVGTQLRQVDKNGDPISAELVHPTQNIDIKNKLLSGQNSIVHPSVLFRKKVFLRAGTYDDHFKFAEDYHFWLKCCKWYKFANLDEILIDYTVWNNSEYDPSVVHHVKNVMNYVYHNIGIEEA